jgi:hypothetical protein
MSLTVTITETRPDLSVAFFEPPWSFIEYIQKYNDIRHRTVYGWTLAPDNLSRTMVTTYDVQSDQDIFLADAEVVSITKLTDAHNTSNGIVRTIVKL